MIDAWQRLRRFGMRCANGANTMLKHKQAEMPPMLTFQYEMLLDARRFERPANQALVRITTVSEEHAKHQAAHFDLPQKRLFRNAMTVALTDRNSAAQCSYM
jgi:hypothetical protein